MELVQVKWPLLHLTTSIKLTKALAYINTLKISNMFPVKYLMYRMFKLYDNIFLYEQILS